MISKEVRIRELTILAEKLKVEHYSEYEMIREMIEVRPADWKNNWLTECSEQIILYIFPRQSFFFLPHYFTIWLT